MTTWEEREGGRDFSHRNNKKVNFGSLAESEMRKAGFSKFLFFFLLSNSRLPELHGSAKTSEDVTPAVLTPYFLHNANSSNGGNLTDDCDLPVSPSTSASAAVAAAAAASASVSVSPYFASLAAATSPLLRQHFLGGFFLHTYANFSLLLLLLSHSLR